MEDSILISIKKQLGGANPEGTDFDSDIILLINSAFDVLHQLGVGPINRPFSISDNTSKWGDFTGTKSINMVQEFVYLSVKLVFDPPTSETVMNALRSRKQELTWRMTSDMEVDYTHQDVSEPEDPQDDYDDYDDLEDIDD